jgi:hypothetical protein
MKYLLLFSIILFSMASSAQDCSKELLAQKPGTWKAGQQGSIFKVSAGDLVKEKAIITSIHKMISSHYNPIGCQVSYSTVYGSNYPTPDRPWLSDTYHYAMYILAYLCDPNSADKSKYYVSIATATTVNVTANAIYWLNNLYAADIAPDDFRGYLKLTTRPQKKDGYYFMGEEKVDYNSPIYENRWLITYNDSLPFSYLTRKEYLLIQKKRLEKAVRENPGEKAFLDKYFKNINDYLLKSETELNQTAICIWNDEERFNGFVEEGIRGSFIAVKPNLNYYHKKLLKSSPQFFTVVYKIAKGDPVMVDNIEAIKKAVDFTTLKNMLGK